MVSSLEPWHKVAKIKYRQCQVQIYEQALDTFGHIRMEEFSKRIGIWLFNAPRELEAGA
jgi:hypothetical protein